MANVRVEPARVAVPKNGAVMNLGIQFRFDLFVDSLEV